MVENTMFNVSIIGVKTTREFETIELALDYCLRVYDKKFTDKFVCMIRWKSDVIRYVYNKHSEKELLSFNCLNMRTSRLVAGPCLIEI